MQVLWTVNYYFKAAQMWCLARALPLLIGDLVAINDSNWGNFLTLLQIEEIVFAPKLSTQVAAYLGVLVQEYLETFSELYDRNIIPKQHFMVHYPRYIIRYSTAYISTFDRKWVLCWNVDQNYLCSNVLLIMYSNY